MASFIVESIGVLIVLSVLYVFILMLRNEVSKYQSGSNKSATELFKENKKEVEMELEEMKRVIKICRECGLEANTNSNYCPECGSKLE